MKNYLVRMSREDVALLKKIVLRKQEDLASLDCMVSDHEFCELMYRLDSVLSALRTPSIQGG